MAWAEASRSLRAFANWASISARRSCRRVVSLLAAERAASSAMACRPADDSSPSRAKTRRSRVRLVSADRTRAVVRSSRAVCRVLMCVWTWSRDLATRADVGSPRRDDREAWVKVAWLAGRLPSSSSLSPPGPAATGESGLSVSVAGAACCCGDVADVLGHWPAALRVCTRAPSDSARAGQWARSACKDRVRVFSFAKSRES